MTDYVPDEQQGGDNKVPCSGCGKAGGGMFGLKQRADGSYRAVVEGRPNRPRRCNVCVKQVQADVEAMVENLQDLQYRVRWFLALPEAKPVREMLSEAQGFMALREYAGSSAT